MKKKYTAPTIHVIRMDAICLNTASVFERNTGHNVSSFRVNDAYADPEIDDTDFWGGQ